MEIHREKENLTALFLLKMNGLPWNLYVLSTHKHRRNCNLTDAVKTTGTMSTAFKISRHFVQASVTTLIRMPSISESTSAHASIVAPVVSTSSTSTTCLPLSRLLPGANANRFSVFIQRSKADLRVWVRLFLKRHKASASTGLPATSPMPFANHSL